MQTFWWVAGRRLLVFWSAIALATTASLAQERATVTIYNQDLALVHERRTLEVPRGTGALTLTGVAPRVLPESVQLTMLTSPKTLKILEQNFEYDLVDRNRLYQRYLDQPVTLYTKTAGMVEGILLNASGKDVILLQNKRVRIFSTDDVTSVEFPELPQGLKTRPALVWRVENQGPRKRQVELNYLTHGLTWKAVYTGLLNADENKFQFSGNVSLNNRCGIAFKQAKLKLVAGSLHLTRIHPIQPEISRMAKVAAAAPPNFQEKSEFEYHVYSLTFPVDLVNFQEKQVSWLPETSFPVEKLYFYEGQANPQAVSVRLKFKNKRGGPLAKPLPAGVVKIYKRDRDGFVLFLGEDRIAHTPVGEEVQLTVGRAFDVKGERRKLSVQRTAKRAREETYEIKLKNQKPVDIIVRVIERYQGDWSLRESSIPPFEKDGEKVVWNVKVPGQGESSLRFTILFRW